MHCFPSSIDRRLRALAALLPLALCAVAVAGGPPADPVDPRWLDRLDSLDRRLLDELVGHAPPAFADDLRWIGTAPATWTSLRGSVVVVQSWTTRSSAGRAVPARLDRMLDAVADGGSVRVVALHTPEGADNAETFLKRRPAPVPVVVDPSGAWCDALGVYKRPVNVVVDRQGAVRYAGLSARGLEEAVRKLVAEPFDAGRPAPELRTEPSEPTTAYPPFTGQISRARDLRGHRAPDMFVDEWITDRPDARGKVVMLDFWATWCGPCVASIPHVNKLARRFGNDLVVVGISDEKELDFERGLRKRDLRPSSFAYSLALDPRGRMKSAAAIKAIPHAIVMSSDWTVRWQGHPSSLDEKTLEQIIRANGSSGGTRPSRNRWRAD